MRPVLLITIILLPLLILSGCSSIWESVSIGKLKGKAEEGGVDYQDTGVIADPYFLYSNRKSINQAAIYPNAACRSAEREKLLLDYNGDK